MLMMLALGGCWDLKMRDKPRQNAPKYVLWFVAINTSLGRTKHETGLACIAQAKPYKQCKLHVFLLFCSYFHILVTPELGFCLP